MAMTFYEKHEKHLKYAFDVFTRPFLETAYACPVTDEELIEACVDPAHRRILEQAADLSHDFSPDTLRVEMHDKFPGYDGNGTLHAGYWLTTDGSVQFFLPHKVVWDADHPATAKMRKFVKERVEMGMRLARSRNAILSLTMMCDNAQQLRATLPTIDFVLQCDGTTKALMAKSFSARHNVPVPKELGVILKDTLGLLAMISMVDAREPEPGHVKFSWMVTDRTVAL